ncbi:uncharacterized protein LOC131550601 isoform X6 [Onychostoma macrolepis]|uniref:uncharacterized protein LOC131550601 isoform X6 n=1 Tax=Onychostoma macrolepis TaxID=369639 RepID=UPI0027299450|nr:uncharacterized protein LOC131550601 isoform X6 [Onychostoma macrolepis]
MSRSKPLAPLNVELSQILFFCLHLCCDVLQNGTCNNFTVAFIETAEKVSCFKVMDGRGAICWTGHQTQSCQIDYRDGKTCIKWPVDTELSCVEDSNEMLNTEEKKKCARDQEYISCNGEYKSDSEPGNSASTLSLSILLITAAITIVHWVSLWHYQ